MKKLLLITVIAIILAGIATFTFGAELIIKHDNNHYTHYHYKDNVYAEKVYYAPGTVYRYNSNYYPSNYRVIRTYYTPNHYNSYSVYVEEVADTRYYIY